MSAYEKLADIFGLCSMDELKGVRYEVFNGGIYDYVFTEKAELYRITPMGRLYFLKKIKYGVSRGYAYYRIPVKKGVYKSFSVHRMLAIFFIPNPENKPEVNHKDKNRLNNSLDNLEWVTKSENERHKHLTYKVSDETKKKISQSIKGEKNPKSKSVRCVETGKIWQSSNEASRDLGRSRNAVANAINRGGQIKGMHFEYID